MTNLTTGSSVADNYIDQMIDPHNPNIVHIPRDDPNCNERMTAALKPYFGENVNVMLDDHVFLGSFPDKTKLVNLEEKGFFILDDTGYTLNADTISAITLQDRDQTPIFLRTYGDTNQVPAYHINPQ
ncbi:MAG: hypothetical protein KAJ91_02180 [Candidatus Aenigmarchaeota archaeon]|nr:hypothetical protein [Candidatus Aenigmarchaeota archaeon]